MGIAVGIDLGTTYSAVARIDDDGHARIIPNRDGGSVTPSVVAVMPDGSVLFGQDAKEAQEGGYTETAAFFKRSMGEKGFSLTLCGKPYTAVDLSAMLLHGLVEQAEEVSGEHVDAAYVTVPAYFRNTEREATLAAARQAGLRVLGLLNEPTAAAFAYGLNGKGTHQTVLIYDLGGGTFDVTLARVDDEEIRILGSDGSHILGGKDWDDAVSRWIIEQFEEEFGLDLTEDPEQLAQIAVLAEKAKKRLSKAAYADISVAWQGRRGRYRLTRETFDDITSFMLQETSDIVDRLFAGINPPMSWKDVDGAILVGGSTRMLQVREYIERMSGKPPLSGVNVDEAVALGAAIRANQDAEGRAVPSLLLGAESSSNSSTGRPHMLLGGRKIVDVTAHALGMISETPGRERYFNNVLIPKNTAIPAHETKTVEMRVPRSGGSMEVYLLQGGEPAPLDNEVAGKYVFSVPFAGNGTTRIDVTYSYDVNGVIEIEAVQTETGAPLAMHREPVPDDMSWVLRSPEENDPEPAGPEGEVYLFIDMSASMDGSMGTALSAAHDFVRQLDVPAMHVGLIGFGTTARGFLKATDDEHRVHEAIDGIQQRFDRNECGSGTNNPLHLLTQIFSPEAEVKLAIILTDGVWFESRAAVADAQRAWKQHIDTVGVGIDSANDAFLADISSMKDLSGLTDLSHLSESFSKIARAIG